MTLELATTASAIILVLAILIGLFMSYKVIVEQRQSPNIEDYFERLEAYRELQRKEALDKLGIHEEYHDVDQI